MRLIAVCGLIVIAVAGCSGRKESEKKKPEAPVRPPIPAMVGEYSRATGPERSSPDKRIKDLGDGTYEIGRVTVDAIRREVRFPCSLNQREGLIEVLICTPWGKVHESVMSTPIRPEDLHLALLLLGELDGSNPMWKLADDPQLRPPKSNLPPGDMLDAFMEWSENGRGKSIRLEQSLMDHRTSQPLPQTTWVFIGSMLTENGYYAADTVGSIITNYHDATTVLDCPLEIGQIDDFTFANTAALPELGTTVTLRIAPIKKKPVK